MAGLQETILSPLALTDKTKDLNDRFYAVLNEITKKYPRTKLQSSDITPTTEQKAYNENMVKMESLQNEYFMYKNDINHANSQIQSYITKTDDSIGALEAQNKILKVQYEELKNSSNSAKGLFDDAQISRNQLLVSNIIFFSIMVGCGFGYYKSIKAKA